MLCAFQSALWGLWLFLPWDSFGVSQAYAFMKTIMPDWAWGGSMLFFGLYTGVAVYMDNSPQYTMRKINAFLGCVFWTAIAFGFLAGNYRSTAAPQAISAAVGYFVALHQITLHQKIDKVIAEKAKDE